MTCEYAAYLRLLLLCGYTDEVHRYVNDALTEQPPLSDIVLDMAAAGSDPKKMLSALNEYLLGFRDSDIDYDGSVFPLVMQFLKQTYADSSLSMKGLTDLMRQFAQYTGRYLSEPWHTLYYMGDLWAEAEAGYIHMEAYQRRFEAFWHDCICFCDDPPCSVSLPWPQKIFRKIRSHS